MLGTNLIPNTFSQCTKSNRKVPYSTVAVCLVLMSGGRVIGLDRTVMERFDNVDNGGST